MHSSILDEDKKEYELELTSRLIRDEEIFWANNVGPIEFKSCINAKGTIPGALDDRSMQKSQPHYSLEVFRCFESIDCATIVRGRGPVVVEDGCLCVGNSDTEITFPFPPSCIAHDRFTDCICVATGNTVVAINMSDMSVADPVAIACGPMLRSAIGFWPEAVVVGERRNLHYFNRSNMSVEVTAVDSALPSVTSMVQVDQMMAVSSRDHHAIHMFDKTGQIVGAYLGHGSGVTCLAPGFDDITFMSGSVDKTIRVWDIRQPKPAVQMQRHLGSVTAVASYSSDSRRIAITGGEDRIVRAWDLRMPLQYLWDISPDNGIPIALDFNEPAGAADAWVDVITKEKDTTTADGFELYRNEVGDTSQNIAVRFHVQ